MSSGLTPLGRRICVVGTSGAGKTHVAEALAAKLGLVYVSNDAIIWRADWQETPQDEVLEGVDAATQADGWTFDGNLGGSPEDQLVLARCDTLVWLDLPLWQVVSQVTRRTFGRAITKEPLWHGNQERWRNVFSPNSMVWWSIKTYRRRRRVYGTLFAATEQAGKTRIRLGSRREVEPGSRLSLPGRLDSSKPRLTRPGATATIARVLVSS